MPEMIGLDVQKDHTGNCFVKYKLAFSSKASENGRRR
jgi:hypothetical protein